MKTKQLLSLTLSFFLLTGCAFASDEKSSPSSPLEELQENEHIIVGSDPLPEELREQMENERVEKYQEFKTKAEQQCSYVPSKPPVQKLALFGNQPTVQLTTYSHAMHRHFLKGVSPDGRFIDTEDGCRWEIAPSDVYKALRWRGDQTYLITPNSNWLSSSQFPYTIVNQQRGSSVKAKLILGPSTTGQNVHWIINIDPYERLVYLENGTVWKVANDDYPYFAKWKINQVLIIGNYYPWFYIFYPYDSILINVNMNHYIHAKQD